jgi:hypothetical protein
MMRTPLLLSAGLLLAGCGLAVGLICQPASGAAGNKNFAPMSFYRPGQPAFSAGHEVIRDIHGVRTASAPWLQSVTSGYGLFGDVTLSQSGTVATGGHGAQ